MKDKRNIVKSNSRTCQPTKHDVVAQVLHFVHYVEDLAAMPKGLRHNADTNVIKKKCDQVKQMLEAIK